MNPISLSPNFARILLLSTAINTKGEAVFVADSVKSNPLAELFAKEGSLDSDSLKDLRVDFI
ncbi:hypothetical protein BSPLISOX_3077, partial [uncultured Gammaproteobacteria bacterium]